MHTKMLGSLLFPLQFPIPYIKNKKMFAVIGHQFKHNFEAQQNNFLVHLLCKNDFNVTGVY